MALETGNKTEVIDPEKYRAMKALIDGSFKHILLMSDTFAFACADAEEISDYDFEKIAPIVAKYGHDALVAYVAVKRKAEPISCRCDHKNDKYKAAKAEIEKINDEFFMDKD
jgi:hypothetical protein